MLWGSYLLLAPLASAGATRPCWGVGLHVFRLQSAALRSSQRRGRGRPLALAAVGDRLRRLRRPARSRADVARRTCPALGLRAHFAAARLRAFDRLSAICLDRAARRRSLCARLRDEQPRSALAATGLAVRRPAWPVSCSAASARSVDRCPEPTRPGNRPTPHLPRRARSIR